MKLTLLRNATLQLSYAGQKLLIDPMLGQPGSVRSFAGIAPNPTAPLPISPAEATKAELVIVSHLHPDHFDDEARAALAPDVQLLCQPGDAETLRSFGLNHVTELVDEWHWRGLQFTRTPGEHGSGEVLAQMGAAMGFVLRAPGEPTLYWLGDTVLIPTVLGVIRTVQPQVIVIHSGGARRGDTLLIMDAEQTVRVAEAAPWAQIVAVHLESLDHCQTSRADLRAAAQHAGIAHHQLLIPADGETLLL